MDSEDGHIVTESILQALRSSGSGADAKRAFDFIHAKCCSWVHFRGALPQDVCLDIVSESIMQELDTLRLPGLEAAEVSKRLLRALDRNRKRAIRARKREVELKDFNAALVTFNDIEEKIEASHMLEVARLLKNFMGIALDSLSDRDYSLIYNRYQLQALDIKPRVFQAPPAVLKPGTAKTALSRARVRLLKELDRTISDAGTLLDEDRLVVRDALRLLRSGSLLRNSS